MLVDVEIIYTSVGLSAKQHSDTANGNKQNHCQ